MAGLLISKEKLDGESCYIKLGDPRERQKTEPRQRVQKQKIHLLSWHLRTIQLIVWQFSNLFYRNLFLIL